jgi:hypothetical protein
VHKESGISHNAGRQRMPNMANDKLQLLQELIQDRFTYYINDCDLDEDRGITAHYFGDWCSDDIQQEYGTEFFKDFNIILMACDYAGNYAERMTTNEDEDENN